VQTVFVHFSNHFDLIWRRGWEKDYVYQGRRYLSYRQLQELCLHRNIDLAERGEGAYTVEQALTIRSFLEKHPDAKGRLKTLYAAGLFEIYGAGEAIIDTNLCSFETLCRNMASGVRYCRDELGMPPLLANHTDGFGSSAQFPQVIRKCGLPGITELSYAKPDNVYWRGLDGSTVFCWKGPPGRTYFFDHCYHQPCPTCRGLDSGPCLTCEGMGLDPALNTYPPFEPVPDDPFAGDLAQYLVYSEEMLPPTGFTDHFRCWQEGSPEVTYRWGTPRMLRGLWAPMAGAIDSPPPDQLSSRMEHNPVMTGCYVSRIGIKQEARRCEAIYYGWETALASTFPGRLDPRRWEPLFLELPLIFFHDAITGTHQDTAYEELTDRLGELRRATTAEGLRVMREAGWDVGETTMDSSIAGQTLLTFNPASSTDAVRVPLEVSDWRKAPCLAARDVDGRSYPVVYDWHRWSPALPTAAPRTVAAVGPSAAPRPHRGQAGIEASGLPPLAWSRLRLEMSGDPQPIEARVITNSHLEIHLETHGVDRITDRASGAEVRGETIGIGGLVLEEDEGDLWGTRKKPAFRNELAEFTRYLGALRFAGYQEAYYGGRYEPCVHFGREEDPNIFALSWYVTVRLLDDARRVDFGFEVFWQSINRRIRAVFPVQSPSDSAWYSIPGGWLERPRYEQTETHLWSPNGDWPALHFVATRPGMAGAGWAVVNHGTPSARVEDGRILVSLLRSPGFSYCLERYAQDYPMPTSTMGDGGWHHFRLSLLPHGGLADMPRLAAAASERNQSPPVMVDRSTDDAPPAWWRLEAEGIEVLSVKRPFQTETDRDAVIRLLNPRPEPNRAILHFASATVCEVALCRLTEDEPVAVPVHDRVCKLTFRPFEVITLRCKEVYE